ncbi:hypothetical protein H4217_007032 [Coemansia sp. RSA 1939]|nr:hypothetical protein H4217_007032 [Coemansia sp. RSA 1939]KAJ2607988.1 hypothetical protein EV177_005218 [Coemansia sp. RSA 1804]KAJ2671191.1 hypothetical protein GGH99_006194 [Coemansia sp. RSA 1285]
MMTANSNSIPNILTLFRYGAVPSVQFSSKAVVVALADEDDVEGTVRIDDIPTVHQVQLSTDTGAQVKRTIIFNEVVAYEMQQQRLSAGAGGRQVYQVCGRTIRNRTWFAVDRFAGCVHVAATHMAQNISVYGGDELARYGGVGFWAPRIRLLYDRAMAAYAEAAKDDDADDEAFVVAQVSVRPFALSLSVCAFPFSDAQTCQVRVCRGLRPESFLRDLHLSADPLGLTRLITPPISDVVLLHPTTQRLSEGLLSNFFATRFLPPPPSPTLNTGANAAHPGADADGRATMAVARTKFYNYHLVCAPLDVIHRGPMLDAVWSICKRDGIQVSFAGANLNDAIGGRWSGAFIVSSTYQLLPIDTMHLTDRRNTKIELGTCPLVTHLQAEILHKFANEPPI